MPFDLYSVLRFKLPAFLFQETRGVETTTTTTSRAALIFVTSSVLTTDYMRGKHENDESPIFTLTSLQNFAYFTSFTRSRSLTNNRDSFVVSSPVITLGQFDPVFGQLPPSLCSSVPRLTRYKTSKSSEREKIGDSTLLDIAR